jgi:hypothetical protein
MLLEPGNRRRRVVTPTTEATAANTSQRHGVDSYVSEAYVVGNRKRPRSKALLDAVRALDTTSDITASRQALEQIAKEYADRNTGTILGLFAKCYLGHPFVDHRLSLGETILEHYQRQDVVPDPFAKARTLAQSSMYAFIEVYSDGAIVPVRPDGPSVV